MSKTKRSSAPKIRKPVPRPGGPMEVKGRRIFRKAKRNHNPTKQYHTADPDIC